VIQSGATTLIVIGLAAFLLPLIAGRFGLPAVVLEILFGILAGPILGVVKPDEFLAALAGLGFLLLLFLSGFEIDLRVFERQGVKPILTGLAVFGGTLAAAFVATQLLDLSVFVTLVLATTSVGLVVPTLRATRRIATPLGQDILVAALLADFLTLLAVTFVALAVEYGLSAQLLALPLFGVVGVAVLVVLRRAAWWWPERFGRLFDEDDPDELGIRFSLALMLVLVGVALLLGIEPILGAFLAGTSFSAVFRNRGSLDRKLSGFAYGFLIPVFFINVGIRFQVSAVTDLGTVAIVLLLLGVSVVVKVVPALLLTARHHTIRESVAAGFLLSARLSLIIVVAELGVELGLLDSRLEAVIVLLAAATATAAPVLFRWLLPTLDPAPVSEGR
jgi:Kef-type K+ transport system membrane component KefB